MKKLSNIWKNRIVTILGFLVLLMPITGFPGSWKEPLYFIFGLTIAIVSFQLGRFIVYGEESSVPESQNKDDKQN